MSYVRCKRCRKIVPIFKHELCRSCFKIMNGPMPKEFSRREAESKQTTRYQFCGLCKRDHLYHKQENGQWTTPYCRHEISPKLQRSAWLRVGAIMIADPFIRALLNRDVDGRRVVEQIERRLKNED